MFKEWDSLYIKTARKYLHCVSSSQPEKSKALWALLEQLERLHPPVQIDFDAVQLAPEFRASEDKE